ncbi:iron export ABC transporter permease subunit FetB [Sutcliffiella horikoshii]|uniref:ABC transporter permease n=1 Tax=Sutcliffiella horikoshii TaxID=79883 RepID=UPI00203AEE90|nr:iron export ABC transporter permease subunit FetB [Sutcliffiella horikoshii]MCM3617282.1 iron export ABC transporter permease subunit FetB [Sutcliffiella horikoshii]
MNILTLTIALVFVLIPIILSKTFKLGLEKDTIIAVLRSVIQLFIVGYLLTFVFEADGYLFIILMVMIMIAAAVQNVARKKSPIKGITWKVAITFTFIEILTQGILIGFNITPPTAQYIIPISGMIIGNSMVLGILFLNRFLSEIETREDEIDLILSLGGTSKQAVHRQLIQAIKASMIPTIESQKTIGLVQLPGMMSGQIIAGASPIQAVQFQLLILFLLLTTASVTSIMLGLLSYPTLFNKRMQLLRLR